MSEKPGSLGGAHVVGVVECSLPASDEQLPPDRALQTPSVDRMAGTRPVPAGRKGLLA